MNYYFKEYLKKASTGFVMGASFGAVCGSAAGSVGLHQMCYGTLMSKNLCEEQLYPVIVSKAENAAVSAGAATGAAIGGLIGATIYPAYKGFLGWCKSREQKAIVSDHTQEPEAELESGVKTAIAVPV